MKDYYQKMRRWAVPDFLDHLAAELGECESILDLGCGSNSPVDYISASYTVGVDMHGPSLFESKKKGIHSENIRANILQIEFKSNSFDAVVALDLLEHLSKQEGIELIEKAEQWAKKKVIIASPNGFIPQDAYDDNPHQRHVSGWTFEDFESMGFAVCGFHGLRCLRRELHRLRFNHTFFYYTL